MSSEFWKIVFLLNIYCNLTKSLIIDRIPVFELFATKIEPQMFNWTFQGITEQFSYRPSLKDYPDLPSWLRYMYSPEYHAGFLYGTPPEQLANKEIHLDIIGLNKQNYETREIVLTLGIIEKFPATNIIKMKIDNLNWIHLMDPGRVENLKNIFRKELWPSSEDDLHLVFMESAVKMGGRVPLRPQQREGVIVHLGSNAPFSERLKELQEEIRPLYKLSTCTYKRTSVQKIFESVGFRLDWCGFRISGTDFHTLSSPEVLHHNHGIRKPAAQYSGSSSIEMIAGNSKRLERWDSVGKNEVPDRNYIDEFAFAFAIPGMIFAVLIGILTVILCFNHENFENMNSPTVQMVQCTDTNNQPTTTLKSLKNSNALIDNISIHSQSPSTGNSYLRPPPPTYKPPSFGKNSVDI